MSKYIIDLRPDCKVVQQICASDENVNVGARSIGLLDELTDDYVKKNFKDLLEGEYQRGLEEGKKATFGLVADASNAEYQKGFEDGKAQREYDDKIEVGDDVIYNGTTKCLVVRPETDERYAVLIDSNGNHHHADHSECKKTGRHFDIDKILEEMRHD